MDLFDPPGVNGWSNGLPWVSSGQFLARLEFAQALAAGRDRDAQAREPRSSSTATRRRRLRWSTISSPGSASRVPAGRRARS